MDGSTTSTSRRMRIILPLASLLLAASPRAGFAQSPAVPPPVGSPIERIQPPSVPPVAPGLPPPLPGPAVSPNAGPNLAISKVIFAGVTAYPEADLRAIAGDLTGAAVPAGRIEDARRAILDLYRRDGYVYTAVSAQISNGELTFVASEGYIAEIKLDGDQGPFANQVLRFLNHLLDARPLKTTVLERWLLLTSDIPGVSVRTTLRRSTGDPGALTLVATVTRKAVSALLSADNRAYKYTGPEEGLTVVDFNSFSEFGERTELAFFHSLDNSTQIFGQGSFETFLGGSGLKLRIYGGAGNDVPTGPLANQGYFGFTTIFGTQFSYPLIRERQQTLNISAYFDAIQSKIDTNTGPNNAAVPYSYDSLRILRLSADYVWFDTWAGDNHSATNAASLKLSQGLHALGATTTEGNEAARVGERTDLFKINFDLARTQALCNPWANATISLRGALSGQYSPDILPPSEEYFLGGAHFNRGYYAGQVTGDSAVTGTIELLLDTPLPAPGAIPFNPTAQFYLFYDAGQAWDNQPAQKNVTLRSVGIGIRFYPTGTAQYEFDLEGAQRLNLFPNGSGPSISALPGQAVYWQVLARF